GGGERDGLLVVGLAKAFAEVDAAVVAEGVDGLAGGGIEAVEEVHDAGEEALLVTIEKPREAAGGLVAAYAGVECPLDLAGGGVEGDDFLRGRVAVERSVDDEGIGLKASLLAGVVDPGLAELADVGAVDLAKGRVVVAVEIAVVGGPV